MERLRVSFILFLIFFLSACSNEKSVTTVFPDANSGKSGASNGTCDVAQKIQGQYIIEWEDSSITVEKNQDLDQFIDEFVEPRLNEIRHVEFDSRIQLQQEQLLVSSSTDQKKWGQSAIDVASVWSLGQDGLGAVVAVIDSGADITHPALSSKIAVNLAEIPNNGVDDDGNGYVDDVNGYDFFNNSGHVTDQVGHGTHVSGIIAGGSPDGILSGVAYKAKILPLNFMDPKGGGSVSDAIRAIQYAVQQKVDVINASWGGAPCSKLLGQAISQAGDHGVLFVVASGNNGRNIGLFPEYPASYNLFNQITVGASTINDLSAYFSNYNESVVHIMAPGGGIYSSLPGNRYEFLDGTSMATPFVTGVVALLRGAFPNASFRQLRQAVLESTDAGPFEVSTHGRVNALKAYQRLQQLIQN